jgi:hypothetical protein
MASVQYATLLSAILGVLGTIALFSSTYTLQPLEGAPFNGPILQSHNTRVVHKNAARLLWQRIGLGLLCLSFLAQAAIAFLS